MKMADVEAADRAIDGEDQQNGLTVKVSNRDVKHGSSGAGGKGLVAFNGQEMRKDIARASHSMIRTDVREAVLGSRATMAREIIAKAMVMLLMEVVMPEKEKAAKGTIYLIQQL